MKTNLNFRSVAAVLSCFLIAMPALACEDNVRANIQFPGGLQKLSVELTSRAVIINGVAYFIASGGEIWCAEEINQKPGVTSDMKPNCQLPKVIFISSTLGKASIAADKSTVAAIEFIRQYNGDPVLEIHTMKAPLNAQGFHDFRTKGSVKARIYGQMRENGNDDMTWSMTADMAKFNPDFGDEAEDISEGIEIRHEQSPLYNRATMHPSLAKIIQLKPSWDKDWNLNCVEGLFSYDDLNAKEDQNSKNDQNNN